MDFNIFNVFTFIIHFPYLFNFLCHFITHIYREIQQKKAISENVISSQEAHQMRCGEKLFSQQLHSSRPQASLELYQMSRNCSFQRNQEVEKLPVRYTFQVTLRLSGGGCQRRGSGLDDDDDDDDAIICIITIIIELNRFSRVTMNFLEKELFQ